jgi:hypothetical protein
VAKRTLASLAAATAFVGASVLSGTLAAPVANADQLANGLNVTCNAVGEHQITCVIGGCPRVNGDYVVDAVHVMDNGYQDEYEFKCINGQTATHNINYLVSSLGPAGLTLGFQGCRKKTLEGDWCGPWSNYTFKPPAAQAPPPPAATSCPAGSETPTVPAGQQCKALPKPDVQCPPGSPTPTVPAGQTCAPIPDVTNAIQASFGPPGFASIDFNVTNTSNIEAACNYTATANSLNPLVPKTTTRQFNVPANGSHTETFSGAMTGTTYNVVLSCKDASGKQKAELGRLTPSVTW